MATIEERFEHWRGTFLEMGLEPIFHRNPPMILLMPTSTDRYALGQVYQALASKLYQYGAAMCQEAAATTVEATPQPPEVPTGAYPPPYGQPAPAPAPAPVPAPQPAPYQPGAPQSTRPPAGPIPVAPHAPSPLVRPVPSHTPAPAMRQPAPAPPGQPAPAPGQPGFA